MTKFSKRLRELRAARDLSQQKLADIIGMSKSSINMYERGEREPSLEMLETIADYFNVDLDYLLGMSDVPQKGLDILSKMLEITPKLIPCLEKVEHGMPVFETIKEGCTVIGMETDADFYITVKDDSMAGLHILKGDSVFIKSQPSVNSGELAAVIVNNELSLKKVYYNDEQNQTVLTDANPDSAPLIFTGNSRKRIVVLGKAVSFKHIIK